MVGGLVTPSDEYADAVSASCFKRGLIIETCGPRGEVVKLLPALTISKEDLSAGLDILQAALDEAEATHQSLLTKEAIA